MGFIGNELPSGEAVKVDGPLYRALAAGDVPGAWLLVRPLLEAEKTEHLPVPDIFNCALCLFLVGEYERALRLLKRAEKSLGSLAGPNAAERELFIQALAVSDAALLPLDPEGGAYMERYALIRVRWLTALCLLRLDRRQEAAPILRFLEQYHIKLKKENNHADGQYASTSL